MARNARIAGRWGVMLLTLLACVGVLAARPAQTASAADDLSQYKLVLAVRDLGTDGIVSGWQHMATVNGDGSNVQQVAPMGDNVYYDWPSWAFNGSKIVYTARYTPDPTSDENIYMSNPDGSGTVQLTFVHGRTGQPHVTSDGRYLVFNAALDEFPVVGLYRMDFTTGQVENLSQYTPGATNDADPRPSSDGQHIALATLVPGDGPDAPTQIYTIAADGRNRQRITDDAFYNTDPSLSADGRMVAFSAYRGPGRTVSETALADAFLQDFQKAGRAKLTDWQIVVHDLVSGAEHTITHGDDCVARPPSNPCAPTDGSGWVPIFVGGSGDTQRVAYISPLSFAGMGVYIANADGSDPQTVVNAPGKVINWHDWTRLSQPAPPEAMVTRVEHLALPYNTLLGGPVYSQVADGAPTPPALLFRATPDLFYTQPVPLQDADGQTLAPTAARWMPDHQSILLSAAPVLQDGSVSTDPGATQVYLASADGGQVRQLTTVSTEDQLAPIAQPDDDPRDNLDPDVSPDGRYVVFTNHSSLTGLSWLLRLDLYSGEIVNLSARTRGVIDGVDEQAAFSPDGQRIAFIGSTPLGTLELMTMRWDGQDVQQLTQDGRYKQSPTWSPDGQWLAYAAADALSAAATGGDAGPAQPTWELVKVNVQTGEQHNLWSTVDTVQRPLWSPDGGRVAFITLGRLSQPDIASVAADGTDERPLRTTVRTREAFFDWR